jgi:uncharacterized membrane protein
MAHPLKLTCILALIGLFLCQIGLFYWQKNTYNLYWILILSLPLLLPLRGLLSSKRYTYKWIGFLTLIYFCVGISELVSNPQLKVYALLTILSSITLFLSSIYYTRYLSVTTYHSGTIPGDRQP